MKTLLVALTFVFTSHSVMARVSGGSRGGQFVDFSAKPSLLGLKKDLAHRVRTLPPSALVSLEMNIPQDWTIERIASVIDNLKIDSRTETLKTEDDSRMKILDFNKTDQTISVLAGFFLYYGYNLSKQELDDEVRRDISEKLLHEVAHLWDFDDDLASEFASNFFFQVEIDAVSCNVWQGEKFDSETNITYAFASGVTYFRNKWIEMGSFPEVPMKDYFLSLSDVKYELNAGKITLSNEEFRLTIGRAVDKNNESWGTYEENGKADAPKKVKCMIGNPRQ